MLAYHFLSVHPKFEVKIPMDGNKPPFKNANSLIAQDSDDPVPVDNGVTPSNQSFLLILSRRYNLLEEMPPNKVMQ